MICALLTYLDMNKSMQELHDVFGLDMVWLDSDAAEIRWEGGVASRKPTTRRCFMAPTSGTAGPMYASTTRMSTTGPRLIEARTFSTNHTRPPTELNGATAPVTERATSGPSRFSGSEPERVAGPHRASVNVATRVSEITRCGERRSVVIPVICQVVVGIFR